MKSQSYDADYYQRNEARIKANSAITLAGAELLKAAKPKKVIVKNKYLRNPR